MPSFEELSQSAIDGMSPQERIARSVEMFHWAREFIGRQVSAENPHANLDRLKLLVALRMYGSEPGMKKLLEEQLADVSD